MKNFFASKNTLGGLGIGLVLGFGAGYVTGEKLKDKQLRSVLKPECFKTEKPTEEEAAAE